MTARLGTVCVLVAALACARATARRQPTSLRDYELVVEGRDSLRDAIALALRHARFHVRRALKGASPPTAALVLFSFRDDSASHDWLHARFFDTRSGVIVAAASIPVDSTVRDGRGRARALVDALVVVRHAP
jgi:hypothetical protein